jgi:hypothetical protein
LQTSWYFTFQLQRIDPIADGSNQPNDETRRIATGAVVCGRPAHTVRAAPAERARIVGDTLRTRVTACLYVAGFVATTRRMLRPLT